MWGNRFMDAQMKQKILIFSLDKQLYALSLKVICKVVHVVLMTEVPGLPSYISGVVNVHGVMMPVINLRIRMNMPARALHINDKMIVLELPGYSYVMQVDHHVEVVEISESLVESTAHINENQLFFKGIIQLERGAVLLCKPEMIFSKETFEQLEEVMMKVNA